MNKTNNWFGTICLLIAAFIWGSTFVAQSETILGPFTYLAMRSYIGAIVLIPLIYFTNKYKKVEKKSQYNKKLLMGGLFCGMALFIASAFQQIGIDRGTDPGKAGFITAMYILLVPIVSIFAKKKVRPLYWICIIIAVIGLFLLCMTSNINEFSFSALFSRQTLSLISIKVSDIFVLISAITFTVHIIIIDKYSPFVDAIRLSQLQFIVTAILATIAMFIFEKPDINQILLSWKSVLYAGVLSSGVGYTLQIVAQKKMNATLASMIMSLESTFAVLSYIVYSAIVYGVPKIPTGYEIIGCIFMFIAIIISQLPEKKSKN